MNVFRRKTKIFGSCSLGTLLKLAASKSVVSSPVKISLNLQSSQDKVEQQKKNNHLLANSSS